MLKFKISPTLLLEITILVSILLSGFVLFVHERKAHDPDYEKSWTVLYFTEASKPEKGVKIENHLGIESSFEFCLISDSDKLTEVGDLSCDLPEASSKETKTLNAGETTDFLYKIPDQKGKFWILATYQDKDGFQKKKSLSFTL